MKERKWTQNIIITKWRRNRRTPVDDRHTDSFSMKREMMMMFLNIMWFPSDKKHYLEQMQRKKKRMKMMRKKLHLVKGLRRLLKMKRNLMKKPS